MSRSIRRADRHWLGIIRPRRNPAAHRRLDPEIEIGRQKPPLAKRRERTLDDLETLRLRNAGRRRFQ
jgi:hypothetical protein